MARRAGERLGCTCRLLLRSCGSGMLLVPRAATQSEALPTLLSAAKGMRMHDEPTPRCLCSRCRAGCPGCPATPRRSDSSSRECRVCSYMYSRASCEGAMDRGVWKQKMLTAPCWCTVAAGAANLPLQCRSRT